MRKALRSLAVAAGLAICAGALPAHAATVTTAGVTGLEVVFAGGSKVYNVAFGDGTCAALFNGCTEAGDFPFTETDLQVAMRALADTLKVSSTFASGFRPDGCVDIDACFIYTPFTNSPPGRSSGLALFGTAIFAWETVSASYRFGDSLSRFTNATFATWTEVVPIPLPASGVLMVAGLGGLAALRRIRRKAA